MINKFISNIIKSDSTYDISNIAYSVWQFIQNELKSKSKLAIVNEILDKDILIKTDEYIIIRNNPFNVLIHSENIELTVDLTNSEDCIQLSLTDNNFKLIIKESILNNLVRHIERANFDPKVYQDVLECVLTAF